MKHGRHILDEIKLPEKYDRRRKLMSEDIEEIKKLYSTGKYSYRTLAEKFNVDKSRITQIFNPETSAKWRKEHWKDYISSKEEHAKAIKKLRDYKRKLIEEGLI